MNTITSVIETVLKKYTGEELPELTESISSTLDNRLLITVDFSKPFKEAKKEFIRNYVNDLLVLSLGNIIIAAKKANLHRRHIHRIINELDIDAEMHRKELIKPIEYMKVNIHHILECTISRSELDAEKETIILSNMKDITELIAESMSSYTYEEALQLFEKEYIEKALKTYQYNIPKTANALDISERTLYRKINKLGIAVV